MTTLQIFSDLHLEFFYEDYKTMKEFLMSLLTPSDYVIMAGDIFSKDYLCLQAKILKEVFCDQQIIYIPGNHEYYHTSKEKMDKELIKVCKYYDIKYLENDYMGIGKDHVIIGACGWHDNYSKNGAYNLNDFRLIKELRYEHYKAMKWNRVSYEFFKNTLKKFYKKKKLICLTHNAPLYDMIPEKYQGSELNPFFANNWYSLIRKYRPDLWISGHIHQMKKFCKENTLFIENGYGYYKYSPVKEFKKKLIISI